MDAVTEREGDALAGGAIVGGHYRVEALLGRGGAGAVYRVRELRTDRRVALKQLRLSGERSDAWSTTHFEREYYTLCQLAHPRIIEVYDYGVEPSGPYYTMELLDGDDLRERGQLPWRETCALLRDVASSLAIVHSRRLVHRDLSARNVRCTKDGRAKLLDFGAMVPMGASQALVGTPPYMPPEALQLQALDGRANLYSLGALAYRMLTGRYAYPAQSPTQLKDLWRSAPPSPRRYVTDLPEQLDQLVMELLQLERAARPRSAAEVMERVCALAGLPAQELPEVGRAYLSMPVLVGREAPLQEVRTGVLAALQGRGGSALIEGAPGMGRTRFLDACVLVGKLLGAVVLRASGERAGGDYAVATQLCAQLHTALPVLVEHSARPRRALLAPLMPERSRGRAPASPPRRHLQAALRDFFLAVARSKPIVIAVDDFEAVDEASAALLGMLAHGAARRRLFVLISSKAQAEPSPALALLRQLAHRISLAPMRPEQTRALVGSLFGEVEHVERLADRIHRLAEGSPRWTMALCERLVERGLARYRAGSWTLPAEITAQDVPDSLAGEFALRLQGLSADARELATVLALGDPSAIPLPNYAELTEHRDHGRTYRALDALVAAAVLVQEGDGYHFTQPELSRILQAEPDAERARMLHARLAVAVADGYEPALRPHHLLAAGQSAQAFAAIQRLRGDTRVRMNRFLLDVYERAMRAAEQERAPLQTQINLRWLTVASAAMLGERERVLHYGPPLLARLKLDSGLLDYEALGPASAPSGRIFAAVQCAEQRRVALPEHERGLAPKEALGRLSYLCFLHVILVALTQEVELMECVPRLDPFVPISSGIADVQEHIDILVDYQLGRFEQAYARVVTLLERLCQPPPPGVDALGHEARRLGLLYSQGLTDAGAGRLIPAELLAQLEHVPRWRGHAWRLRMASELMRCNFEVGYACMRRAELVSLQDGGELPGLTTRIELAVHVASGDLTGLKRLLEPIEALAARYPGWRSTLSIARSHYLRVQGDPAAALEALGPALELTRGGRHSDWEVAVRSHLMLLCELGRHPEAVEYGRQYAAQAAATEAPLRPSFHAAFAQARIGVGELDAALASVEAAIATLASSGARGLALGGAYETRARVAIAMRDEGGFQRYAELCGEQYNVRENATMNARYERLLREGSAAGLAAPSSAGWTSAPVREATGELALTVNSRMLTCIGAVERANEGLRLLIEDTRASGGYLFGIRAGDLQLLASVDDAATPPDLCSALEEYLRNELEAQTTRVARASQRVPAIAHWVDSWGREFEPLLLRGSHEGEEVVVGVAALHYEAEARPRPRDGLIELLVQALLAEDVIDPITCVVQGPDA